MGLLRQFFYDIPMLFNLSFCVDIRLSFALWPIWGFLSLPLLVSWILISDTYFVYLAVKTFSFTDYMSMQFTLFMVSMVVLPSIMIGILKRKNDDLRVD